MTKIASVIHGLALALLAGGIAGIVLAIDIVFDRAPSREIAGQIGNVIFGRLAPAVLGLSLLALGARIVMQGADSPSWGRTVALVAAILTVLIAAVIAFWLTPSMNLIWKEGLHAADGSGLAGDDRTRFLTMHIWSAVLYLGILSLAALQITLTAIRSR